MGESIFTRKGGGVELTGNATTDVVFSGYTFYSNNASNKLTGTFAFTGNAATTDVSSGKTFYATNGTKLTGTGSLLESSGSDNTVISLVNFFPNSTNQIGTDMVFTNDYYFKIISTGTNRVISQFYKGNFVHTGVNSQLLGTGVTNIFLHNNFIYVFSNALSNTIRKYNPNNLSLSANTVSFNNSPITRLYSYNGFLYAPYTIQGDGTGDLGLHKIHENNLVVSTTRRFSTDSFTGLQSGIVFDGSFLFADIFWPTGQVNGSKLHEANLTNSTIVSGNWFRGFLDPYASNGFFYTRQAGFANIMKYNASTMSLTNYTVPTTTVGNHTIQTLAKGPNGTIITLYGTGVFNAVNDGVYVRTHYESNGALLASSLYRYVGTTDSVLQKVYTDNSNNVFTYGYLPFTTNGQVGILQYSVSTEYVNANGVRYYKTK